MHGVMPMSISHIAGILKLVVCIASHHSCLISFIFSFHINLVTISSAISIAALTAVSLINFLVNDLVFASLNRLLDKGLRNKEALVFYGVQRRLFKLQEISHRTLS